VERRNEVGLNAQPYLQRASQDYFKSSETIRCDFVILGALFAIVAWRKSARHLRRLSQCAR